MTERPGPHGFAYVHTDIPDGIAIGAWRAQRAAERRSTRMAACAARRRRRRRRLLGWITWPRPATPQAPMRGGEAHG
jgi:hypothetical protein